MANKKKTTPKGQITLTLPALGFAIAMLVVGGTTGYMVGKAKGLSEGGTSSVATEAKPSPQGNVVNNTDGQLRRLSGFCDAPKTTEALQFLQRPENGSASIVFETLRKPLRRCSFCSVRETAAPPWFPRRSGNH